MGSYPNVPDWVQSDLRGLVLIVKNMKEQAVLRGEEESSNNFEEIISQLYGLLLED